MTEETLVSGPVNVVRLEGTFNDNNKVLYVFMDHHMAIQEQTNCGKYKLYSFNEYLIDNFKNSKELNYYLEYYPDFKSLYKSDDYKYNEMYIIQARMFFNDNYNISDNKIVPSKMFKHVRFHYIDFRMVLKHNKTFQYDVTNVSEKYLSSIFYDLNNKQIKNLLTELQKFHNETYEIYNFIFNELNDYKPTRVPQVINYEEFLNMDTEKRHTIFKNYLYKTFKSYNSIELFNTISELTNTYLKTKYENLLNITSSIIDILSNFIKQVTNIKIEKKNNDVYFNDMSKDEIIDITGDILKKFSKINYYDSEIGAYLVDVYFIRRYLDKQYHGNSLVYTGSFHSTTYINFLVKYCNFTITHYSYLKYDKEKTVQILKEKFDPWNNIQLFTEPNGFQCSNLTTFPKNFE